MSLPTPSRTPSVPVAPDAAPPTQADLLDFVRRTAADRDLVASLPLDPEGRTWGGGGGP
ncbi:cysteine dioxygenase, partial [Streptomyces sp. NPDC059524]